MNNKEILKMLGVKVLKDTLIRSDCVEVVGCINGFFIYPYNYYWIIKGKMPLKYAEILYKYRNSLGIRVEGGANNNKPLDWCTSDEYEEFCEDVTKQFKLMSIDEFSKKLTEKKNELKENNLESFYISTYHIDDIKGLKKVVDIIRDNDIKTNW